MKIILEQVSESLRKFLTCRDTFCFRRVLRSTEKIVFSRIMIEKKSKNLGIESAVVDLGDFFGGGEGEMNYKFSILTRTKKMFFFFFSLYLFSVYLDFSLFIFGLWGRIYPPSSPINPPLVRMWSWNFIREKSNHPD